jgi:hypothetical protein
MKQWNPNKCLITKRRKRKGNVSKTNEIENAAAEALKTLSLAAEAATKTIADAAALATGVIATAAADAAKLAATHATQNSTDHDLLIELRTKMDAQTLAIKLLGDDKFTKVMAHETRLNELERSNIRQVVAISVGTLWLFALSVMLIWHLFHSPLT